MVYRDLGAYGMDKQYRDEIAMVCHDMMKAGQSVGAVSNAEMREFETNCFVQEHKAVVEVENNLEPALKLEILPLH
jgi:hypothetical protein